MNLCMCVCCVCLINIYYLVPLLVCYLFLSQISFSLTISFSATANFGEPSFPIRLPPYSDG